MRAHPEYGALRHFRLRAFELTLAFTNVKTDATGEPISFDLKASVRSDPSITSAQAEQTGYLTPYREGANCVRVVEGNDQRMCRDNKGSWTECAKLGR